VSGLAVFLLTAGEPDSVVGWLIVSSEIAPLASEVSRADRARVEPDSAEQIESGLGAELA
jgi:hypothetical protein